MWWLHIVVLGISVKGDKTPLCNAVFVSVAICKLEKNRYQVDRES